MLLAVITKFNLEVIQLDAVNVFVYADLGKTVFMYIPFRYDENGKVLSLNKALYSL